MKEHPTIFNIEKLSEELNINFDFIDFGGGLGIPYRPSENPLDLNQYEEILINPFIKVIEDGKLGKPNLKIEPGRYISGELKRVRLGVKKTVSRAERAWFLSPGEESEARIRAGFPRWGNSACF